MELTKEDVSRLLTDPSPQARAMVAEKIGHQLEELALSENELQLAQDIARHMAKDIAVQVRMSLAISVKKASHLPHDVALKLARDVEQVSLPVLEFSTVLNDDDLMDIVRSQSSEKQEAIARRDNVSEKLADAIVNSGTEESVVVLMKNKTAQITEHSLLRASERYAASEHVQESIVKRPSLPMAVAERLVDKVSESLRDYLVQRQALPSNVVSDIIVQTREKATATLLGMNKSEQDIEKLVRQLKSTNRLTPSLIIRALCMGDVPFFEFSMSALADVPITNARVLLHDAGKLGLKSLYDKTGLPQGMFAIIRVALEVVKEIQMEGSEAGQDRYRAQVLERILTQYEDFNQDDLSFLLDRLSDLMENAA